MTSETEKIEVPADAGESEGHRMKWYVVTTYSGYENKVKEALRERIRQYKMEDRFGEVLIPSESVTLHGKDGKSRVRSKTTFPGYLFVEMMMSEEAVGNPQSFGREKAFWRWGSAEFWGGGRFS